MVQLVEYLSRVSEDLGSILSTSRIGFGAICLSSPHSGSGGSGVCNELEHSQRAT